MAGAEIVETNTFGANFYRLSVHGLGDKVAARSRVSSWIRCPSDPAIPATFAT